MDVVEARSVLGVTDGDGWDVVRAAYRHRIRAAHPDTHGVGATATAVRLNEAYAVLSRARRTSGAPAGDPARQPAEAPRPAPPPPPPAPPATGLRLEGSDTLLLAAPPDEAFALLLEAGHQVGNVSYVDRSCAIFEVMVRQDDETCSLVVTLQARGHGTEALLTLEAIERVASLSTDRVLERVVAALT